MKDRQRKTEVLYIRLEEGESERLKQAARVEGIPEVSVWARARLRRFADEILRKQKKETT